MRPYRQSNFFTRKIRVGGEWNGKEVKKKKMARGRPPKPNAIKIAEGNPGKRTLREEPNMDKSKPRCPRQLMRKDAIAEWDRIVSDLHQAGLLVKADRTVMVMYCQAWAQYIEAEDKVLNEGAVTISPNGYPQKSAWLTIRDKAFDQMMKCLQELGMTPVARARVAASEPKDEDAFTAWFGENAEAPNKKEQEPEEDLAVAAFMKAAMEEAEGEGA